MLLVPSWLCFVVSQTETYNRSEHQHALLSLEVLSRKTPFRRREEFRHFVSRCLASVCSPYEYRFNHTSQSMHIVLAFAKAQEYRQSPS